MDAFAVHGWIQERAMSVLVSVSYNKLHSPYGLLNYLLTNLTR
jgi:hypothetical protein